MVYLVYTLGNKGEKMPEPKLRYVHGEWITTREASERYGVNINTIRGRIHDGWSDHDACTIKTKPEGEKHGMEGTKVYQAWSNIKRRCRNKNNKSYKNYGKRGIQIADEFYNSFKKFYKEIGDPPSETHSIDRIDNSKGYIKGNIRWANYYQQGANKRNNKKGIVDGVEMIAAEAGRKYGIEARNLRRLMDKHNCTLEEAIKRHKEWMKKTSPKKVFGEMLTIGECVKKFKIPKMTLVNRIKKNKQTLEEAIASVLKKRGENVKQYI